MSGPSSDGRPSLSSNPSAPSSRTLNSRWSSPHDDNGEGSSRPSLASGRRGSRTGGDHRRPDSASRSSDSPLREEAIGELDFAHRRLAQGHRPRRSGAGGFLLDDTFAAPTNSRLHGRRSGYAGEEMGPRGSRHGRTHTSRVSGRPHAGGADTTGSMPLSRPDAAADERDAGGHVTTPTGDKLEHDGQLHPPKVRDMQSESSTSAPTDVPFQPNKPPRAAMNSTDIINMALQLSESRRRNLSAGQLVAPQPSAPGRVGSIGARHDGSFREVSAGGSLRQYLNEQRRVSRTISPLRAKATAKFSARPDTWARAEKFRTICELRWEYLRLLEYLPPLKPDALAPGNFIISANNVPGSPHAFLTRVPSYAGKRHDLGRPYNPLQYLRDRRTRARERKSLDHMPEDFGDPEKVRTWIDKVSEESQLPDYRRQDRVALPAFHEDHEKDATPSRSTQHRAGWHFTIEELFADTLWLEQNGNKSLIEDRYGHRIFPAEEPKKQDFLQPRASREYPEKRRKSWVDNISGVASDAATGDESDLASERGRKRRLLPAFRGESPRHRRRGWKGSLSRPGIHSDTSDSESDLQRPRSRRVPTTDTDPTINTSALGLQLKGMLEQEAKEAREASPGVVSPDTPDKWGLGYRGVRDNASPRSSVDFAEPSFTSVKSLPDSLKVPPNNATSSETARKPRSSFDYPDSTPPRTPSCPKSFHHVESGSSPPSSRGGEPNRNVQSKSDPPQSDDGFKTIKYESLKSDSDSGTAPRKRPPRNATEDKLGTSVKSFLSHKHNESVSSVNSPKNEKGAKEPKDPSSAVTRFFKGVKNEGTKVGEFIFRRDRPPEDSDSDSDPVEQPKHRSNIGNVPSRPRLERIDTTSTIDSDIAPNSNRYHVDLPTFRSYNEQASSFIDDPITPQSRARANSRSPRFDKLAPPRIELGSLSSRSSPGPSRTPSPGPIPPQPPNNLLKPENTRPRRLSTTSVPSSVFSETSSLTRSTSRQQFTGRHWSITDDDANNPHKQRRRPATTAPGTVISSSDIARIRALFLASGIKAREIDRRAHIKRPQPPAFLTDAATAANAELIPVPRKEEHALAARILVRNLEASTTALQDSAEHYRAHTIADLSGMISALKSRVEADLFPTVRAAGDEALRITAEVSANAPLGVKQLSDEMDKMVRMRRRRTRWVRRVGWMLVEWTVLGIMWWVWLVVVVGRMGMRVCGGVWGVVKWLLWI